MECVDAQTPEVLKLGVNPDRLSQETRVRRSACSGVRCSVETGYAKVKSPEA
jgi:hypothetical protein